MLPVGEVHTVIYHRGIGMGGRLICSPHIPHVIQNSCQPLCDLSHSGNYISECSDRISMWCFNQQSTRNNEWIILGYISLNVNNQEMRHFLAKDCDSWCSMDTDISDPEHWALLRTWLHHKGFTWSFTGTSYSTLLSLVTVLPSQFCWEATATELLICYRGIACPLGFKSL